MSVEDSHGFQPTRTVISGQRSQQATSVTGAPLDALQNHHELLVFYLGLALDFVRDPILDESRELSEGSNADIRIRITELLARAVNKELDRNLAIKMNITLNDSLTRALSLCHAIDQDLSETFSRAVANARAGPRPRVRTQQLARSIDLLVVPARNLNRALVYELNISRLLARGIINLLDILDEPTLPPMLVLNLVEGGRREVGFSTEYLCSTILPYADALLTIHDIAAQINDQPTGTGRILAIRSGSVSLDLTGGIRDTVELILDNVVAWRRENHKRLKQHEADMKAAEAAVKQAEADQARAESEAQRSKAEAEAELARAKAREQELLNLKLELELKELALQMARRLAPDRTTDEQLQIALRLYDPTRTLVASPLEVSSVEFLESQSEEPTGRNAPDPHPEE